MNNKQRYVCGFLFSEDKSEVVLIQKNRPDWQAGKLNGVGGKVEDSDEDTRFAMIREFFEEAGTSTLQWKYIGNIHGADWEVNWFTAFCKLPVISTTDEVVAWYRVSDVLKGKWDMIPNLKWLIPLALEDNDITFDVDYHGSYS
jgi:8-oxo-dGTP diphosphatase